MSTEASDPQASTPQTGDGADVVDLDDQAMEEVLEEEQGSLLSALLSQVHFGMDLSKVTLPTFILEPRSFLEKMTDFFTHPRLLFEAVKEDDPRQRMIKVAKWYLSGFHVRPKGVKKPYNPILGETFRAWHEHADNSCTYMVCEQVSHHPPVSAFYINNRKSGFVIEGFMAPKSRFLGTSAACILNGHGRFYMINRDEVYKFTFPTLYVRGLIFGKLLMEYGDKVKIECEKTGYSCEIEFKVKGYFFGSYNAISGKIKGPDKKTTDKIEGNWTSDMYLEDPADPKKRTLLWDGTKERVSKMKTPPESVQTEFESRRLWSKVTAALNVRPKPDQNEATKYKTELEEAQRAGVRERKEKGEEWKTKLFHAGDGKEEEWYFNERNVTKYDETVEKEMDEKFARDRQAMRDKAKTKADE